MHANASGARAADRRAVQPRWLPARPRVSDDWSRVLPCSRWETRAKVHSSSEVGHLPDIAVIVLTLALLYSERQPRWVAYCASVRRDRILLSGDNGLLYIFDGHNGIGISSTQFADRMLYENDDKYVKGVCPLLSVAEVPVQVSTPCFNINSPF